MLNLDDILKSHLTGLPVVMGILNVTPDSFYDGGRFLDASAALEQAHQMVRDGADIIDIGAESTRPQSHPVSPQMQIERLGPIFSRLGELSAIVSIDTTSAQVARVALDAGASIINDVSAGRDDPQMLPLAASRSCAVVLMHMLGSPRDMQKDPQYLDVVTEVRDFLDQRMQAAISVGVAMERVILDPGIGFGKRLNHNLALLSGTETITSLGRPVLIGVSRKRFIGELAGVPEAADRVAGTISACLETYRLGATIFRVHDPGPVRQALTVARAIRTENI